MRTDALRVFPDVRLIDYASAARASLSKLQPTKAEQVRKIAARLLNGIGRSLVDLCGEALLRLRPAGVQFIEMPRLRPRWWLRQH